MAHPTLFGTHPSSWNTLQLGEMTFLNMVKRVHKLQNVAYVWCGGANGVSKDLTV